tara:strand:- start:8865 stop:9680 length:816 start_codon:yes stop_codon:yes gene_type:complete
MKKRFILILLILLLIPIVHGQEFLTDLFQNSRETAITEESNLCGNGIIDSGETCSNCKDAICSIDELCDANDQCIPKKQSSNLLGWIIFIIFAIPGLVYFYYHFRKDKIEKEDKILFVASLVVIIIALIILYLNISTLSLSLLYNVDPSATIIIEEDVNEKLTRLYDLNGNVEFFVCLKGKYDNNRYQIYDVEEIPTTSRSIAAIETRSCSKINHLGTIHSHPNGLCELSKQDIYSFGQRKDILMGVICKKDTFGFFTKKNFERPMFYIIK